MAMDKTTSLMTYMSLFITIAVAVASAYGVGKHEEKTGQETTYNAALVFMGVGTIGSAVIIVILLSYALFSKCASPPPRVF
jgi:heme/copper-type cytochrome/quinol oxidase subunit 2